MDYEDQLGTGAELSIWSGQRFQVAASPLLYNPGHSAFDSLRTMLADEFERSGAVTDRRLWVAPRNSFAHRDTGPVGLNHGADHHSRGDDPVGVGSLGKRHVAGVSAGHGRDSVGRSLHWVLRAPFRFSRIALHILFVHVAALARSGSRMEPAAGLRGYRIQRNRRLLPLRQLVAPRRDRACL